MSSDGLKTIYELALLLAGLASFPFAYYKAKGWKSSAAGALSWLGMCALIGAICVRLLRSFHDAGGDISGGYEKLVYGIFLLGALPALAALFGLAAISVYLVWFKEQSYSVAYYPALGLVLAGLWVIVPPMIGGKSETPQKAMDQSKPQGSGKADGEEWAYENDPATIEDCRKASSSKDFIEGCSRHLQGPKR